MQEEVDTKKASKDPLCSGQLSLPSTLHEAQKFDFGAEFLSILPDKLGKFGFHALH